jgi:branched-subunit amino acid transport protein
VSAATAWTVVGLCAVVTAVIKGIGPLTLGGRELPSWFGAVVVLLAPALLAALVVTQALADGDRIAVAADTAGVAAAGVVLWRGGSILACVAVAAVVTAGLRAAGL